MYYFRSPAHGVKKPCDFFALTHAVILDSIPSCLETLVCPSRNFSYNHNPSYLSNRSSASHRHSLDEKIQNLVNESEKKSRSDPTSQKLVEQNLHVRDLDIDQDRDNKSQKSTYNSSSQKSKNSCDDDSQHEIEHEDLHENLEIQYENQQ